MIIPLRTKSLSLATLIQNLKWVSTITFNPPQLPQDPEHQLRLFLDGTTDHNSPDYELSVVSALKSCSSLLAISQGQQIHYLILKYGLDPNTFIRNSLINMYVKCGSFNNARSLFDSFSRLDPISCNIMIVSYVNIGQLENVRRLFEIMPNKDCVVHYYDNGSGS